MAALAGLVLWVCSPLVNLTRLHLGILNDQIGYVTVARRFAETGRIASNLVFPSTLLQPTTTTVIRMPGHYAALAASYTLFGFGVFQSLLPNLVSYVAAAAGAYLIGARFYSRRVGRLAAALFILFPANVIFAFTAMAEMTLVAAAILAFCVFVYLPRRLHLLLGPLLVVIPFLFRETAALMILPMATVILAGGARRNARSAALFGVASLAALVFVYRLDLVAGRPSLLNAQMFDNRYSTIYTDAVAMQAVSSPSLRDWLSAPPDKVGRNLRLLFTHPSVYRMERFSLAAIALTLAIALAYAAYRRDFFAAGTGLLILALGVFILALYDIIFYRGLRLLLITVPLGMVVLAAALADLRSRLPPGLGRFWPAAQLAGLFVLLAATVYSTRSFYIRFREEDAQDDRATAFLEQLKHDDSRLLVTPAHLPWDYLYRHYPVGWSHIPANRATLDLLAARYKIGTFVLPSSTRDTALTPDDLAAVGLALEQTVEYEGEEFLVFKADASP